MKTPDELRAMTHAELMEYKREEVSKIINGAHESNKQALIKLQHECDTINRTIKPPYKAAGQIVDMMLDKAQELAPLQDKLGELISRVKSKH